MLKLVIATPRPWARKVRIALAEKAMAFETMGGGVFKKRLNKNMHRSILLAKRSRHWIYEYLFAKNDRANIDESELKDFRVLANGYAALSERQIERLVEQQHWMEICHGYSA